MENLRIYIYFLAFFGSIYIPSHSQALFCLRKEQNALFIFGDSLFDAGNNNYINTTADFQANFWPYGETSFKYPTGRPSNGLLIPDFIAEYAKIPYIPPYLQPGYHQYTDGSNFASAGAGALVETNQGFVIDLKTQLKNFNSVERLLKQRLGNAEAGKLLSEAIYFFSIGNNDYLIPFISNSSNLQKLPANIHVDMVIGNLTTVIKEIYRKGGRKFGITNLAPWGCLPVTKAAIKAETRDGCAEEVTELVKLHNTALAEVLPGLETQLKGFKYSYLDFYTALSERMKEPSKYGFKEANIACCGGGPYRGYQSCGGQRTVKEYELCDDVEQYVFFDAGHPTEKAYRQIAELMWNGGQKFAGPYNLKQLFEF